ncbi:hypothetical protein [Novosphingobium sp.]|uniref:hypothetical protein n=1 Tax=Novosphingobium sp. TaxID=1874826 RepID=UPI0025F3D97F|nr:hypothetical protein [Novosphingobium sp.]
MADPAFPPIDRDLAQQLDALQPPVLSGDFAVRLTALALETPQAPAFAALPPVRWRAVGRRARLGIAVGSLALIGLGSVSAAAAGYLGEPVNRAVHRLPVVGKLIEKVIPEKRRLHHSEAAPAAGLKHRHAAESPRITLPEPRPAAADASPIAVAPPAPMIGPGWRSGRLHVAPPWRYPGPLPRTLPPGPERRAAIAAFRAFRAAHPVPPEVIARRQRRAAIIAERRAIGAERLGEAGMAAQPSEVAPPALRGPLVDPAVREQRRIERRRARIEARRLGIDPVPPRFQRRFNDPQAPGRFRNRPRWQDWRPD